jgi:hypothetical protein
MRRVHGQRRDEGKDVAVIALPHGLPLVLGELLVARNNDIVRTQFRAEFQERLRMTSVHSRICC